MSSANSGAEDELPDQRPMVSLLRRGRKMLRPFCTRGANVERPIHVTDPSKSSATNRLRGFGGGGGEPANFRSPQSRRYGTNSTDFEQSCAFMLLNFIRAAR